VNPFAYREKMGFGIPLRAFMSSQVFQDKWKNQVQPGIQKRAVFNIEAVSNWVNNISTATADQLDAIWLMVGFELWAQQYLD
jgi:asparagine synthase (glutamine-hydrolysing)